MGLVGVQYAQLDEIILAIKKRLIDEIPDANEGTVRVTADPSVSTGSSDTTIYNITPGPRAIIDDAAMDGGGELQLTNSMTIVITVHLPSMIDDPKSIELWWTNESSMNVARKAILRALMQFNPPRQSTGLPLLNHPMLPTEWGWSKAKNSGDLQVAFNILWDEDLDQPAIEG